MGSDAAPAPERDEVRWLTTTTVQGSLYPEILYNTGASDAIRLVIMRSMATGPVSDQEVASRRVILSSTLFTLHGHLNH